MHEKVAEKFAELFASCAVKGDTAELQKEAAANNLVKSAEGNPFVSTVQNVLSNPYVYVPAATAAAGGALGYGKSKKKDKLRNALHYAMMGGLTGLGGVAAAKNLPIFGGGSAAPEAAGAAAAPAAAPAAAAAAPTPAGKAKPAVDAPSAPTAPANQTAVEPPAEDTAALVSRHADMTGFGTPGDVLAPRGAGAAGVIAGGMGGRKILGGVQGYINNRITTGELNGSKTAIPPAKDGKKQTAPLGTRDLVGGLREHYAAKPRTLIDFLRLKPANRATLNHAIMDIVSDPANPLGIGSVGDPEINKLRRDADRVLNKGSLGPLSRPQQRSVNATLLEELRKRAPAAVQPPKPGTGGALAEATARRRGRGRGLGSFLGAAVGSPGVGVGANALVDALQNMGLFMPKPTQEQPK